MTAPRIVIVGAGPVGMSAALFLVERGIAVTVLERAPALVEDMRASTFHPATLDMLAQRGIAERLVSEGHKAQRWQFARLDTGEQAVFDLSVLADQTAHPFRLQCEQYRLTRAIVDRLRDDPLFRIHFGTELVDFQDDGAGVSVHAHSAEGELRLPASFLVGADGATSVIRRLLGMELAGATYPKTSITVVVDFPFEDHLRNMLFVNYVWTANDHYSLMRISQHWRTGFSPADGESLEDAMALPNVRRHLARILPAAASATVVHVGAYTIQRRIVDRFRRGRVLLAGDAAHLNSPAGGMGMNSGIHDARSMARALAEVLDGGSEAALDRYASVRRQIALDDVQVQSDRNYRRHREKDPQQRQIIWRELQEITSDPTRMRAYLMESSMLASVMRSDQAEGVRE